eukprot:1859718-Amphidinium_carterae.3
MNLPDMINACSMSPHTKNGLTICSRIQDHQTGETDCFAILLQLRRHFLLNCRPASNTTQSRDGLCQAEQLCNSIIGSGSIPWKTTSARGVR